MKYSTPKQSRAVQAERQLLDALATTLVSQSYTSLSIESVAERACVSKSTFLKRFGSKKYALLRLFEQYCYDAMQTMDNLSSTISSKESAVSAVLEFSESLEQLQTKHFASNRAMHELFLENLEVDERTQKIFLKLVNLMREVQAHHLDRHLCTDTGAFSAAQLLVTINYNFVLQAMPALPRDHDLRHRMISKIVVAALEF